MFWQTKVTYIKVKEYKFQTLPVSTAKKYTFFTQQYLVLKNDNSVDILSYWLTATKKTRVYKNNRERNCVELVGNKKMLGGCRLNDLIQSMYKFWRFVLRNFIICTHIVSLTMTYKSFNTFAGWPHSSRDQIPCVFPEFSLCYYLFPCVFFHKINRWFWVLKDFPGL